MRTILVMFKRIAEHAHCRQPERFSGFVGWVSFRENFDDILDDVACISGNDGLCNSSDMMTSQNALELDTYLESAKENLQEFV